MMHVMLVTFGNFSESEESIAIHYSMILLHGFGLLRTGMKPGWLKPVATCK